MPLSDTAPSQLTDAEHEVGPLPTTSVSPPSESHSARALQSDELRDRGAARTNGARAKRRRSATIVLVVACSDRKRLPVPPDLQLGSIKAGPDDRASEWQKRLARVDARPEAAESLYSGDHWQWAREAHRRTQRYSARAELWVISAGHGLIPADEIIKPYSATFAAGAADSVWRGAGDGDRQERLQDWWGGLGHRATLADLLLGRGDGAVVIAAGGTYLEALQSDLQDALGVDASGERVSVISAGGQQTAARIPFDTRFRSLVGGTNSSLNARVLAWLAAEPAAHDFRRSSMSAELDRAAAVLPPIARPIRETAADDEIATEIERMRDESPEISRTRALRQLRDRGVACEQGRFASLWTRVSVQADAGLRLSSD